MSSTSISTYASSNSLNYYHSSSSKSLSNYKSEQPNKKTSIEDFEFIKELGQGSYGKVILGIHKETGKKYAIKVIDKFIIDKLEKTHEIFIERDMLTKILNHPNIIKFIIFFKIKKYYFLLKNYI